MHLTTLAYAQLKMIMKKTYEELDLKQKEYILERFGEQIERYGLPERIEFYDRRAYVGFNSSEDGTIAYFKW